MKKILLSLIMAVMTLSSMSAQRRGFERIVRESENLLRTIQIWERISDKFSPIGPVHTYIDRVSGVRVAEDQYNGYVYLIQTGTHKLLNAGDFIDVFRYQKGQWVYVESVSKRIKKYVIPARTHGRSQNILIQGYSVKIMEGYSCKSTHNFR